MNTPIILILTIAVLFIPFFAHLFSDKEAVVAEKAKEAVLLLASEGFEEAKQLVSKWKLQ